MIRALLIDAANTLIHKPDLWSRMHGVIVHHGYSVDAGKLKHAHKMLSESTLFPDRTDADFYLLFNTELLFAVGIIPHAELLEDLFKACSYLPWKVFEDVEGLEKNQLPISVLSNFNTGLAPLLKGLLAFELAYVISSEEEQLRKPNVEFYHYALNKLGLQGEEVLYIGDSLKLDIEPAQRLGIHAYLMDRDLFYPAFKNRIISFHEVPSLLHTLNAK
jgi:FMN phosphatase YigB (HAD superfamily)